MVIASGYCKFCGHTQGCIGHYPSFTKGRNNVKCTNCNMCSLEKTDPVLDAIHRIFHRGFSE